VATLPQADPPRGSAWPRSAFGPPARTSAEVWPLPRRLADFVTLDSSHATALYWGAVGLLVAGFFVTRLLPCVDYPQHLALSDIARRLADPSAPEHRSYQLNYFTYNGLFHVAVARLAMVMPIELAGRSVVATSLVAMAGAVVALLRVLRRPVEHAALFTPILFSFSLGWGFVNYLLATSIAAWALVFVAHVAARPSWSSFLLVGVLGLACAFAHVLAMLILCLASVSIAIEVGWRASAGEVRIGWRVLRASFRALLAGLPLLLGCLYCIEVYLRQYDWDPNMYRDPTMEGSMPPLWQKVVYFGAFASDLYRDASDQLLLWTAIVFIATPAVWGWLRWSRGERVREASPPILAPAVVLVTAYLATPMVLVGTHLIFPRLGQWAVLGAVLAMPSFPEDTVARARSWMLRVGALAGLNAFIHCAVFAWETSDASRVIDDLPSGGAATAVIWEPGTHSFRNGTLTHLAAYYAARKHGQWAFAFARYLSVPVRFKEGAQPAWPARGWEFDAEEYDPRCKYARAFPLVLVKAPPELGSGGEVQLRALVFKQDAGAVKLVSHHGRYWAFDTAGLPSDGVL
jgi:hypothetical protein